jgi:hypothetical protein
MAGQLMGARAGGMRAGRWRRCRFGTRIGPLAAACVSRWPEPDFCSSFSGDPADAFTVTATQRDVFAVRRDGDRSASDI